MLLLSALIFLISVDSVRGKPNFIIMLMDDVSITECKSALIIHSVKIHGT